MRQVLLIFAVAFCCMGVHAVQAAQSLDELRERASEDPLAAVELAEKLFRNPEENGEEIVKLCRFAANKGSVRGKYLWGKCYGEGVGVKKNYRQAFALYKQAAAEGDPEALNAVGLCYTSGLGTKANELEAYAAFVESALLNNRDAKYNLGRVYEKGLGVQNNIKTAIYWYEQAAAQGQDQAIARLAEKALDPAATNVSTSPAPLPPQSASHPPSPLPPPTNAIAEAPSSQARSAPQSETAEDGAFHLVLPKWLLWCIGLGAIGASAAWGGFLWWKKNPTPRAEASSHHRPHRASSKKNEKTFSCIQCGQLLLIPNYSSRKMLECPTCHSDYEVWRDKHGILHLQNRDNDSGMKTYISFGEETAMQSPYAVLGIAETCSMEEAREAFRKKMKEYHPDRVMMLGEELRELAALKAREINEAYNLVVQQKQI